jgi:two-component system sensor histidine kinase/response regulator
MEKRVLVVDDHEPTRRLIRTLLEAERREAYVVEEAATGAECLRRADEGWPFHLIVLDVNLPDMDGYTVCRAIRSVHPDASIVFLSAHRDLKSFNKAVDAGGDSYLMKPVDRSSLSAAARLFSRLERRSGSPASRG